MGEPPRGVRGGAPPPSHLAPRINREEVCPFLVRVFVGKEHNRLTDYAEDKVPEGEIQVYTWEDETMRDLVELVKQGKPETRGAVGIFSLSRVFMDRHGVFDIKEVARVHSTSEGPDDHRVLGEIGFEVGDFLDVALEEK